MAGYWPETKDEFLEWFWKGQNGNDLIKELNQTGNTDRIRREKFRPHIYGIVLKDGVFPFKEQGQQWKLCKVGFTHKDTTTGTENRMEQLQRKIESKYEKKNKHRPTAAILFVLAIGAVDTREYNETEKRIREKVGRPVAKDVAKRYGLECSTEWVLTTQSHIDRVKDMIERYTGNGDKIDIFKDLSKHDVPKPSKRYQDEWLRTHASK